MVMYERMAGFRMSSRTVSRKAASSCLVQPSPRVKAAEETEDRACRALSWLMLPRRLRFRERGHELSGTVLLNTVTCSKPASRSSAGNASEYRMLDPSFLRPVLGAPFV